MNADRFNSVTRAHRGDASRRGVFGALSALGLGALAAMRGEPGVTARNRNRKCTCKKCNLKNCPPTPPAFCAGKNACVADAPCQASGPACFCWARADAGHIGEPLCGQSGSTVADCADCPGGTTCVITGGNCGSAFLCALPCPDAIP